MGNKGLVGQRIDRYELTGLLGTGGMATVYRARHISLGTESAVKVLASNLAMNPLVRERFRQEAYVQAQLRHPGIVSVLDLVDNDQHLAIVMELVDGGILADEVAKHPAGMPVELALSRLVAIAEGVAFAHEKGVLHRDLKPANVLLSRSGGAVEPKVTDFGLARLLSVATRMTRSGAMMGTPGYMAPEQMRGEEDVGPPHRPTQGVQDPSTDLRWGCSPSTCKRDGAPH